MFSSLEDTDMNMVTNQDGLDILMERLKDAQEIAIDLEVTIIDIEDKKRVR